MTACRNPEHYPDEGGWLTSDPQLHAAGPVVLVGGVPAVVDASPCHREGAEAALGARADVDTAEALDGAPEPVYDEDGIRIYQGVLL